MDVSWVCGLDLGTVGDYTAFVALERSTRPDGKQLLEVLHLERWPLGTPYTPGIVEAVKERLSRPPLPGCLLAVDQTGVGRPVVDLFRTMNLPTTLHAISITAGATITFDRASLSWHVPKKDLVGALQVLMGTRRLKVSQALPLWRTLTEEMQAFRVKITKAGNETWEAWRERDHDDLVLATALACWIAERMPAFTRDAISTGGRVCPLPVGAMAEKRPGKGYFRPPARPFGYED